MIAGTRYYLALLFASQRYLPPVLAFLALLAVLYTSADAPVAPEFAVSAGGLVVVACWLTVAVVAVEDPVQRLVTAAQARSRVIPIAGVVATVFVVGAGCAAVSTLWAVVLHGGLGGTDLASGAGAHLAAACTGVAIGLPCSGLVVRRLGVTVVSALAALAVVFLVRWVPLVNPMLRALTSDRDADGTVLVAVGASVGVLVLSALGTAAAHRRRRL